MRPLRFLLPIPLQFESLIEILSSAEHLPMACENDGLDAIVDAGDAEEVLEFVGHDVCEGIVVIWAVKRADQDRSRSWGRGRMVRDADFSVGEGLVGSGEFRGDGLAG